MTTRAQFLAERRAGIGGSDIAGVLGVSPWSTPLDVWRDKVLGPDDIEDERMRWGNLLEPVLRQEAARKIGLAVSEPRFMRDGIRLGNLDGVAEDGSVVELKTAASGEDWGAEWSDDIPDHYQAQVQWYLGLAAAPVGYLAVLIGGSDFRIYKTARDDAIIGRLVAEAERFWRDNVLAEVAPPPMNLADARKRWRCEVVGRRKPVAPVVELLEAHESRRLQIKALEEEDKRDETLLRCYMEECEALVDDNGSAVFTLKTVRRGGYVVEPTEYRQGRFTKWWGKRHILKENEA